MWYSDTAGVFDDAKVGDDGKNVGLKKRSKLTAESKEFELVGPLLCDIFMVRKFRLGFVDLQIKLIPNAPEYFLMSAETGKEYKIEFTSLKLKVRKVKIANHVILAHANCY